MISNMHLILEQLLSVGSPKYGKLEKLLLTQEQGKIEWGPLIPSLQSLCIIANMVLEQDNMLKNRELVAPSIAKDFLMSPLENIYKIRMLHPLSRLHRQAYYWFYNYKLK